MGVIERRHRHRASLRRDIVDAASRLFVEKGYDHVTMRRIAERIEYSPTTLYLHFKDKTELFNSVCEETFSQLATTLERLSRMPSTPLDHLRAALRAYVDFGVEHPNPYTVAFLHAPKSTKGPAFETSIHRRTLDMLRQAVQACAENGDIRTSDPDLTAQALWAAVHGVTSLSIAMQGSPFVTRAALIDHTLDTLLAGLKAPTAPPRAQITPRAAVKADFTD